MGYVPLCHGRLYCVHAGWHVSDKRKRKGCSPCGWELSYRNMEYANGSPECHPINDFWTHPAISRNIRRLRGRSSGRMR